MIDRLWNRLTPKRQGEVLGTVLFIVISMIAMVVYSAQQTPEVVTPPADDIEGSI